MTSPFGTPAPHHRGWVREGGVFLFTSTLLLISGCAMKGDVQRLQDEVAAQSAQQEAQLRTLTAQFQADIQELTEALEVQSGVAVNTRGGTARQLRDMQDQLSQLVALTGQIQRSLAALSEQVRAEGARVTTSDQRADPDSLRALIGRGAGDPCEEMWNAAVTQLNRGSFGTARAAFGMLLNADCPDDAPRAQLYLASALEEEGRLDQAIEEFLRVTELHPTADEVPQALYRIALIYILQEDEDEAMVYLERLTNTYPDSDPAVVAEQLLQEIR
jgi:TolA-binding protein